MNFVIYLLLICGFSIWKGSFSYKDVAAYFKNFLVLQGSLMSYNIIFKCGKDSLMSKILFLQKFLIHPSYIMIKKSWWYLIINWFIGSLGDIVGYKQALYHTCIVFFSFFSSHSSIRDYLMGFILIISVITQGLYRFN
jgi:hypothetical protein